MWRFIILALAAFILYKLFMGDRRKKVEREQQEVEQQAEAGVMVKDPICGSYVASDSDIRVRDDGKVQCFCSYECRDKYLQRLEAGRADSGKA